MYTGGFVNAEIIPLAQKYNQAHCNGLPMYMRGKGWKKKCGKAFSIFLEEAKFDVRKTKFPLKLTKKHNFELLEKICTH